MSSSTTRFSEGYYNYEKVLNFFAHIQEDSEKIVSIRDSFLFLGRREDFCRNVRRSMASALSSILWALESWLKALIMTDKPSRKFLNASSSALLTYMHSITELSQWKKASSKVIPIRKSSDTFFISLFAFFIMMLKIRFLTFSNNLWHICDL